MAEEIFSETVMIDLIVTFSKGHRAKLTSPLDWQTPLCYMSVIHLEAVTSMVNELLARKCIIDLSVTKCTHISCQVGKK